MGLTLGFCLRRTTSVALHSADLLGLDETQQHGIDLSQSHRVTSRTLDHPNVLCFFQLHDVSLTLSGTTDCGCERKEIFEVIYFVVEQIVDVPVPSCSKIVEQILETCSIRRCVFSNPLSSSCRRP